MSPVLMTALMGLGTLFSLAGILVMHLHRKQRRKEAEAVQDVPVPQYSYNTDTGLYTLVEDEPKAHVYQVGRLPANKRRIIAMAAGMFAVFLLPILLMPSADAAISETMRNAFSGELKEFVTGIMSSDSAVSGFAWMIFTAFSVLLFFGEVIKFIWQGNQMESHMMALAMFFITFMLMGSYDGFTEGIWGIAVGISDGYQQQLVGNTDSFFLSNWLHKTMGAVVLPELSFWDSLKFVGYDIVWRTCVLVLDLVAFLAAVWADFGYAVSKVVGFCFIPCLLLPVTRNLFDGWFKFFTGFGFLLIVLKATMVVAAIAIKAIIATLGVKYVGAGFGDATAKDITLEEMARLADAAAMLFVAALFVLSSFAFASTLAGGVGNISGGLGTAANLAVKKMLK